MRWRLWIIAALALIAGSCGGSDGVAVIERQVAANDALDGPQTTVCHDVEAFARGSHAGDDLGRIMDELARLSAVIGANDALPHVSNLLVALDEGEDMARPLDAAAEAVDAAGYDECEIPLFTAMYVSTSYASCFGRAPIAAGTMAPDSTGCETDIAPEFLPCFDPEAGHIPVDCRTNDPVVLRGGEWQPYADS